MSLPSTIGRSPGLSARTERHLLQAAVAVAGFAPVLAGLAGALLGGGMTGEGVDAVGLDSQVRGLSGLLLAVGLAYWEAIPQIERRAERFRLLTAIVVLGGLMRLVGMLLVGMPSPTIRGAVVMELVVAPALCLWQARVARRCGMPL